MRRFITLAFTNQCHWTIDMLHNDLILRCSLPEDQATQFRTKGRTMNPVEHMRIGDNDYPVATELGPTGDSKCPECGNSLQNTDTENSFGLRRCASCKTVFAFDPEIELTYLLNSYRHKWTYSDTGGRYYEFADAYDAGPFVGKLNELKVSHFRSNERAGPFAVIVFDKQTYESKKHIPTSKEMALIHQVRKLEKKLADRDDLLKRICKEASKPDCAKGALLLLVAEANQKLHEKKE